MAPNLDGISEQAKKTAKVIENVPDHHVGGVVYTDTDPEPKFGEKCLHPRIVSIRNLTLA